MAHNLPAITGKQLIRLLRRDGWEIRGKTRHGIALFKAGPGGNKLVTIVPDKRSVLPSGTLAAILGPLQTNLGRAGLSVLIDRYGVK